MDEAGMTGAEFARTPLGKVFLGGLPLIGGTLTLLVALGVLPYRDLRPNRIAVFNDPHSWQVASVGVMLICFGLANLIPPRFRWIGRFNVLLLAASVLAVFVGVLLGRILR